MQIVCLRLLSSTFNEDEVLSARPFADWSHWISLLLTPKSCIKAVPVRLTTVGSIEPALFTRRKLIPHVQETKCRSLWRAHSKAVLRVKRSDSDPLSIIIGRCDILTTKLLHARRFMNGNGAGVNGALFFRKALSRFDIDEIVYRR
jgi:hypothetical protein